MSHATCQMPPHAYGGHRAPHLPSVSSSHALLSACGSGLLEVACLHPFDTVAKRLMTDPRALHDGGPASAPWYTLRRVQGTITRAIAVSVPLRTTKEGHALRLCHTAPLRQWIPSLYHGLPFAAPHRVCQRVLRFGGQPIVSSSLHHSALQSRKLEPALGLSGSTLAIEAGSGAIVALLDLFLLPLDRFKVLAQANPSALTYRNVRELMVSNTLQALRALYQAACVTACRNVLAASLIFGGTAVIKQVAFKLQYGDAATPLQNGVASFCASGGVVLLLAPLDVLKTRQQSTPLTQRLNARDTLRQILRQEGSRTLYRGVLVKTFSVASRFAFGYTVAQFGYSRLQGVK